MSNFINSIEELCDETVLKSLISRNIVEYRDNIIMTIGQNAFYDWTQEQSIYFEGESYPENLDANWKNNCNAKIYLNGVLQN